MLHKMKHIVSLAIVTYCMNFSVAFGESIIDSQQWLNKFNQVIQTGQQDEIRKAVVELPTRAANRDALVHVIDLMAVVQKGRTPSGVRTVQTTKLGELIFRSIIMANFDDNKPLFILFDFLKGHDGWILADLSLNTDLNPLLGNCSPPGWGQGCSTLTNGGE